MKKVLLFFTVSLLFFLSTTKVFAYSFKLIAPSGVLQRGQEVVFTIKIDPKGESLTSAIIGLNYDTEYLEFLSAIPGDTFDSIISQEIEKGKIVLSGTDSTPVTQEGIFARVKFKLIAESPGTTELCSFFNPQTTPTPTPKQPTATPKPGQPTATPKPPVSGNFAQTNAGILLGIALLIAGGIAVLLRRKLG